MLIAKNQLKLRVLESQSMILFRYKSAEGIKGETKELHKKFLANFKILNFVALSIWIANPIPG